jgi:hypothetical protein
MNGRLILPIDEHVPDGSGRHSLVRQKIEEPQQPLEQQRGEHDHQCCGKGPGREGDEITLDRPATPGDENAGPAFHATRSGDFPLASCDPDRRYFCRARIMRTVSQNIMLSVTQNIMRAVSQKVS